MIKNEDVLLKVRNVKKYFKTPSGVVKAIDDVSFDVKQGEVIGLIGESGSGKTTVGRCLIRLYDGFSGFISLDGQSISGRKITRKKKKFLNQNMQMIFQDPHASLNGQNNIYTILREPLIVNKIMKAEYDDLFKDWQDVIDNFVLEFSEEVKKIELDALKYHVQEAEKLLKEWENSIESIGFDYKDIESDFNKYFSFKLTCQEREKNVINKYFKNNSKIFNLYFECQKKFRNDSIILIEQELKKKKHKYEEILKKSKKTDFKIRKGNLYKEKKEELNHLLSIKHETIANHGNIIDSYIQEFQNDSLSNLEHARNKQTFKEFNVNIKKYLLSKEVAKLIKENKRHLIYLSSQEIDNFVNEIRKYASEFEETINNHFPLQKFTEREEYKAELKNFISIHFDIDIENYVAKSKNIELKLNKKIKKIKTELPIIRWTFDLNKLNRPAFSKEDVERSHEEYLHLKEEYDKENELYKIDYEKRMLGYNNEMIIQSEKLENIRKEIKILNEKFNQKHKEFLLGLSKHLEAKGRSKTRIENQIKIYENKIKSKEETLKSFNVEVNILKKDTEKLKHLLGLKRKAAISKKCIKKILMNEKIYKALEDVGLLRQFAWRYPHEFSGGQRQRIVIARALISNPKIIIADEPIASLDVSIQAQVVNILKDLCEKKNVSLIFIAHDLSMVEYIADKILIMHLGKIVEFGKTEEIYSNPVHPYTINLFKSVPKISNANDKFQASNFELHYLEEQHKNDAYVDFFALNNEHIIYSTISQFKEWTKKEPVISEYTKNPHIFAGKKTN